MGIEEQSVGDTLLTSGRSWEGRAELCVLNAPSSMGKKAGDGERKSMIAKLQGEKLATESGCDECGTKCISENEDEATGRGKVGPERTASKKALRAGAALNGTDPTTRRCSGIGNDKDVWLMGKGDSTYRCDEIASVDIRFSKKRD